MKNNKLLMIIAALLILLTGSLLYIFRDKIFIQKQQTIYGSGFEFKSCKQITEKDIYELCERIYDNNPEEFEAIFLTNRFHQHVGPNNIYGAKMALYAKDILKGKDHEISVESEAGMKPPIGCLNDGIMMAIAATYGRGLIENVGEGGTLAATFTYEEKQVRLEVKPEVLEYTQGRISEALQRNGSFNDSYFEEVRGTGLDIWENYSYEDLFIVTYPNTEVCEYSNTNVNLVYNKLHDLLHETVEEEEIKNFIKEESCITNGEVTSGSNDEMIIRFTWGGNGEVLEYTH